MCKTNPRPIKVTATLVSPLAGDPPQLDALLEWVYCVKINHDESIYMDRSLPAPAPGKLYSPLVREWIDGWPVPLCSSPILSDGLVRRENYAKRIDMQNMDQLATESLRKVSTTGDWTKSYRLPLTTRRVEKIVWFAVANRVHDVHNFLSHLTVLGKKTSQGYGVVSGWTVEDITEDWSWFADSPEGCVLMRTLPIGGGKHLPGNMIGWKANYGGVIAPYWHPDRFTEVVQPC